MPGLEDCYCPRCSRFTLFSQVGHTTKANHRKKFGAAAVERPLSSQFLDEFGPSVHQTNTQPTSGSEGASDDSPRSNSGDDDTEMEDGNSVIFRFAHS
jgi:hypothetical protein